jgi:hypothetical protein
VSDGFRSLADQIGDPIRLGEIGTFKLFEFDIGMAAGKQCGDVPISGVPGQLIPGISGMFTSMIARSKAAVSIACKARLPVRSHLTLAASSTEGRRSEDRKFRDRPQPPISRSWFSPQKGEINPIPFRPTHQVARKVAQASRMTKISTRQAALVTFRS